MGKEITSRAVDYSQWYIDLVKKADLAENSDVRGCTPGCGGHAIRCPEQHSTTWKSGADPHT